jgi:hypothetical protein
MSSIEALPNLAAGKAAPVLPIHGEHFWRCLAEPERWATALSRLKSKLAIAIGTVVAASQS